MVVRRRHRDGSEHRPGARHEDETEAQTQDEPTTLVGVARGPEAGEGSLDGLADFRNQEADGQEAEQCDAEPEQEVLGEVEETE